MGKRALISSLGINHNGELFTGFRNLGLVYFPYWKHRFPTKIIGKHFCSDNQKRERDVKIKTIFDKIANNADLWKIEPEFVRKYWEVMQLSCSPSLADCLPDDFVRGHYTQVARWLLASPGSYVDLDDAVFEALKKREQLNFQLFEIENRIRSQRKKAYATRTINDMNALFDSYSGKNLDLILTRAENMASLRSLDNELLFSMADFKDNIRNFNLKSPTINQSIVYRQIGNSRKRSLRVEQIDWNYLKDGSVIDVNDLLLRKWLLFDIEIPFFRRENPWISWIGCAFCGGADIQREIHTLSDTGVDEINGYSIFTYPNESSLIGSFTKRVVDENPDVVSTYNTRFDLIKLRESDAGFLIGDSQSPPLFKATTPFFERIGIKDRFVIDFLRWQKISHPYEPNAKLEMAAGFKKGQSYDDLEQLEIRALAGDRAAAIDSATYLAEDVERLLYLKNLDEFKKNLEDVLLMSELYGVGFERLLHSSNCINDTQEKLFFNVMGLFREEVPPHERTMRMQKVRQKATRYFYDKAIVLPENVKTQVGTVNDVVKAFFPIGSVFSPGIARRFPKIRALSNYSDSLNDEKRKHFIERYLKEFCRWGIEDYGGYLIEEGKFDEMTKWMNIDEFEDVYHTLRRDLLLLQRKDDFDDLNKAKLTQQALSKSPKCPAVEWFRHRYKLGLKDFQKLVNQRSKIKRKGRHIIGNYDVFPDRRFFVPEKRRSPEEIFVLRDSLDDSLRDASEFLCSNDISVVGKEGCYFYFSGNTACLWDNSSPFIPVDRIPIAYSSDNVYYEKNGFYSHMNLKDNPSFNLSIFEMNVYEKMLKRLLNGNYKAAEDIWNSAIWDLKRRNVNNGDLIFYNKSKDMNFAYILINGLPEKFYYMSSVPEDAILHLDESTGFEYYEVKSDDTEGEDIRTQKINIAETSKLNIDLERYIWRLRNKGRAMLEPVRNARFEHIQPTLF